MKLIFILALCIFSALAASYSVPACESDKCKLPACKCSQISGVNDGKSPQFLVLSFDDSVSSLVYNNFIKPVFISRKNPDGCPVSGTFFVPHEYSDYTVVNELYGKGYEIASHSITKNYLMEYWRNATLAEIKNEMGGQRQLISKFANIPESSIIGARMPQLQLNYYTFNALKSSGFQYDSSWPTLQIKPIAPYTLDYESVQQCHVVECQTQSVPGLWESPIVDWVNQDNADCNTISGCDARGDAKVIFEWMKKNFLAIKLSGAPITFRLSYSWYIAKEENKDALEMFLDYIKTQNNTFIVSNKQVLDYSKNPTQNFTSCQKVTPTKCTTRNCRLYLNGTSERYMNSCVECPKSYPWLGNPLGK